MRKKMAGLAMVLLACLMISGCVVCGNSSRQESGKKIRESTLKQLEPGKTTKEWTLSVLGTPTSRNALDNGVEVFKYEYTETVDEQLAVFLILASDSERKTSQSIILEFKDDILTKYWMDRD